MSKVVFDESRALPFLEESVFEQQKEAVKAARATLLSRSGAGNDYLGWLDLPVDYDKQEFARIQAPAERIRANSDALVVIGIGGSYLGARAAIEMLGHPFASSVSRTTRNAPEIFFVGNQISTDYACGLMEALEGKRFSINVISKSGTTTEPAIAFRLFKQFLEERVGKKEAARRIFATTDRARGALKTLADGEGYETFVVPDDIGGRYSVLTAVGLLPIAVAGIDIEALMRGAAQERSRCMKDEDCTGAAARYAVARNTLYREGKAVEILANYEPGLHYVSEWWKQLYGESEGKDRVGLYPASVDLTTDLHSMGQFIRDGSRVMFETVIRVKKPRHRIVLGKDKADLDGLNYLAGKTMDFVNENAMNGTILAHTDGDCPNLMVRIPDFSAASLGALFYFFEFACGLSGYMLGINPFNQPGVESYKKNMFALLGKPGYEAAREELLKRL